jgi:tetratricopeptide (TPR) repeat protein
MQIVRIQKSITNIFIFLILCFIFSCATVSVQNTEEKHKGEIKRLILKLRKNPNDINSLQELGIISLKIFEYEKAKYFLELAFNLDSLNMKTIFYYGLSFEFLNKEKEALELYQKNVDKIEQSPFSEQIKGRYFYLSREMIREKIQKKLDQNKRFAEIELDEKKMVVFPLFYTGDDREYALFSRGLNELMINDLKQIKGLSIVERFYLMVLMQKLKVGQTWGMDDKAIRKISKLLGTGQVVSGVYNIEDKNTLNIRIDYWNLNNNRFPISASKVDVINNIFLIEKRIVFSIITKMGIKLSQEKRKSILKMPTLNVHAFLSYCKGLEKEDMGELNEAFYYYNKAEKIDPRFKLASKKVKETRMLKNVGYSKVTVLAEVDKIKSKYFPDEGIVNLVNDRLQNISHSLGVSFIPSQDSRETLEEAINAGSIVQLKDLPDPPEPPGK